MEYDPSKKKPEEKMAPVVKSAKLKKESAAGKASKLFFEEDINSVKDNIIHNYIIPGAKNFIYSVLTNAIGMSLFGQNGMPKDNRNGYSSNVSYGGYYRSSGTQQARPAFSNNDIGTGFDYDRIVYDTAGEAELVLDSLEEALDRYPCVTVADLYDLSGITPRNPQTNRYGWTNLRNARVIKLIGGGFGLSLPKPRPID